MMESLKDLVKDTSHQKADYYRLAYQTARERIYMPKEQFHSLILRLIGDKDHDKVLDIVSKVEKSYKKQFPTNNRRYQSLPYLRGGGTNSRVPGRCFLCHKFGHFKVNCPEASGRQKSCTTAQKDNSPNSTTGQ